ncbi:MAG: TPR end-of-group domain-containing protein [Pseudomonadota bacterium]
MKKLFITAVLGFAFTTAPVLATSKSNVMTNDAIGQSPSINFPDSGAEYWNMRTKAVNFARQREWEKAIPLLEKLTKQYQDDGDTWFLLGHGYLQAEQYKKAITALERTLQIGTIMSGIKSASSPSNDIMIKIAQCYSAIGNKTEALAWIQKAIEFRWDDRKSLINNAKFEKVSDTVQYQKLSGEFLNPELSRNDAWTYDLYFLLSEIKRLHVDPYHKISAEELELKTKSIAENIPNLNDQQIVFQFMDLLAAVGNGHNFIVPTHSLKGAFTRLPVQFYWFNDGMYIVKANSGYKNLIGRKVISVENEPVEQVMEMIGGINARDNEMQQHWLGPYYLALPEVLEGLDIVNDAKSVAFTLADKNGKSDEVMLTGEPFNFSGFPTLPGLEGADNPEYLARKSDNYWYLENKKSNYFYIQFNAVAQSKSQSLSQFSDEVRQRIKHNNINNVVLDLRHNSGGNGSIVPPLTRALIHFVEQDTDNKLFVIVGRNTFSAAHLLLADLNRLTDAIIVGEPSGSRPNHLGEAGWFKLPYSGVWGIISSQYHQASKAEDHRIWIAPHLPVTLSSESYFSGEDPAMKQILEVIEKQ